MQVLEQLKLEPEAAMLTDRLIEQAGAVHTIMPAGHRMGIPQVQPLLHWHCACTAFTDKLKLLQGSRRIKMSLYQVE